MTAIKQHVEGNCTFQYFRDSSLWYKTEKTDLLFPVPVSEIGTATFNAVEKGIYLMRHIRRYLDALSD